MSDAAQRFPITFEPWYRPLSTVLGLPPSQSYVEVVGDDVHARMGWAFRARFPRASVVGVSIFQRRPLSRGVHGFAGRWLVNGSGRGILAIDIEPRSRAYVMGFPIRLRQLLVSVGDPAALGAALTR